MSATTAQTPEQQQAVQQPEIPMNVESDKAATAAANGDQQDSTLQGATDNSPTMATDNSGPNGPGNSPRILSPAPSSMPPSFDPQEVAQVSPPGERTVLGAEETTSTPVPAQTPAQSVVITSNRVSPSNEPLAGPIVASGDNDSAPTPNVNATLPAPAPPAQAELSRDVDGNTISQNIQSGSSSSASAKRPRPEQPKAFNDDGSPSDMRPWMAEIWPKLMEASSNEEWRELMRLWGELEWTLGLPEAGRVSVLLEENEVER